MRLYTLLWLLLGSVLSVPCEAAELPEQIVKSYYDDLSRGDWAHAASLFDPEALSSFKGSLEPVFGTPDGDKMLRRMYGDAAAPSDVIKSTPQDFYARFMQTILPQGAGSRILNVGLVGSVQETPALMHVLVRNRTSMGSVTVDRLEIVSLRNIEGQWRIALNGDVQGIAEALKARRSAGGG